MIEIIREESGKAEKQGLPKDIKQIGKPDIGDRIYVENQVYQSLHPHGSPEEKRAYVLLGRFENYAGRDCVFVEAAIWLRELEFEGELPLWNDQTWAYIYKQLKREYDSMVIVGWALDIKGQLPNMTARIEKLHQSHFGGPHQLLFRIDSLEREETFYGTRSGHLYRREGFYIYYKKGSSAGVELGTGRDLWNDAFYQKGQEFGENQESDDAADRLEASFYQEEEWSETEKETDISDYNTKNDIRDEEILGQRTIWSATGDDALTGTVHRSEQKAPDDSPELTGSDIEEDEALQRDRWEEIEIEAETARDGKREETAGRRDGWFSNGSLFGKYFSGRGAEHRNAYRGERRRSAVSRRMADESEERQPVSSYASTFFLLMVVCLLGITAYLNNEKMAAMEETLSRISQAQSGDTDEAHTSEDTEAPGVMIEHVTGDVKRQEDQQKTDADETAGTSGEAAPDGVPAVDAAADPTVGGESGIADGAEPAVPEQPDDAGVGAQEQPAPGTPDTDSPAAPDAAENTPPDAAAAENTAAGLTDADAAAAAMAEARTWLDQGYYIVQKGDSLVGICRRVYQTTAMLDKLCEVNGIEDENTIYAGQKLILPN